MLDIISLTIIFFTEILLYLIIFDVILSWLSILGIRFRPRFLSSIIDPLYKMVKSIIPTSFGPFDFTPAIIFIVIIFIRGLVFMLDPNIVSLIERFIK